MIHQSLVETGLIGLAALGLFIVDALKAALSDLRRRFSAMDTMYLSIILYTLVIHTQGVDLIQPFAPAFMVFATSAFYAKQALAHAKLKQRASRITAPASRVPPPVRTEAAGEPA